MADGGNGLIQGWPGASAPRQRLGEFERIARAFRPLATAPGALGLTDDAALIGCGDVELVLTVDAIVAGIHFIGDETPELIARKLLRVNYSDIAAMGAAPTAVLLAMSLPRRCDDVWVERFAAGLGADLALYGGDLLGGDMTSTGGSLTLSLTAVGSLPRSSALRRSGARVGDDVYVSGTLGDGAFGLRCLQGLLIPEEVADRDYLVDRYRLPQPRLALGQALRGIATSCMDVSDGLLGDLGHICAASGVGAVVEASALPLSPAAARLLALEPELMLMPLTGGDDYELLFTAPPEREGAIAAVARDCAVQIARIGRIVAGSGVMAVDRDGAEIPIDRPGWRHFSEA